MRNERTRPRQARLRREVARLIVPTILAALVIAIPNSASAYWSVSSTEHAQLEAAVVPPPQNVTCTSIPGVILLAPGYALIEWDPVTVPSGTVTYQVYVNDYPVLLTPTSETSFEARRGLLTNIVTGLLELLLGGGQVPVTIEAVHSSGWVSQQTQADKQLASSVLGLLEGLQCE